MVDDENSSEPELSFGRSDIERRIGFPAGRYTSPGVLLPVVGMVVLTVGVYGLLTIIPYAHIRDMFTQRGVVPYIIVILTAWSLSILAIKNSKLSLQRKALSLDLLPTEDPGFILTTASTEQVLENLYHTVDDPKNFILTRRIHTALANLRNMGQIGDVADVLGSQADSDEDMVESSYTILRGLIWAIPVFGFVGTVLGLSQALGYFGSVLSGSDKMDQLRSALQDVTGGLSTAFETTLLGLLGALCVHFLMVFIRRREEQFLDECKDYCQNYIIGRLKLIDTEEQS